MKVLYEKPLMRLSSDLGYIVRNQLCGQSATGFFDGGAGSYGEGTINDYTGDDLFD